MKQFGTILRFELKNYYKNKTFVGITVFLVILIAAVMFFPKISALFQETGKTAEKERSVMLVTADTPEDAALAKSLFSDAFADYEVQITENSIENIKSLITSGKAKCAFVLDGFTSYTYYVNNLSMYDQNTRTADDILQNLYRLQAMEKNGVSAETAGQILAARIEHSTQSLGKDQLQNFYYTYIMIFALYMVILLYGQMVATNVATEKSSRAMELLITSAKPTAMMFGKVIASCIAGLVQLICVFGSAFLFFHLNKADWGDNQTIHSIFNMPLGLLLYMLLFFVLGFFVYAFLYSAVGSIASKLEDINTSSMPITILFIISFMVVIFSMTSANVDSVLMKICSFIPFTSPMAMFTRIAMSTVPVNEILISIAILIASVIAIGVFSAKIYRVGVLLYGTTPKLGSVLKSAKEA